MRNFFSTFTLAGLGLWLAACTTPIEPPATETTGSIDRRAEAIDRIVPEGAEVEILASGFVWPEGPVWVEAEAALYFNDVPENKMYRWTETKGAELFLTPSGGGSPEINGKMREAGANGIIEWTEAPGKLLLADHGARSLTLLDPQALTREAIVSAYQGKTLNSPNDIVARSDGALFFTDPPYGLDGLNDAPEKELPFNGVYFYHAGDPLKLVTDQLSFPNGVGLSPDEKTLYVAVSDPEGPRLMAYKTLADGGVENGRVLFDASSEYAPGLGLPDGMAIAENGTIFATGPNGVYVIAPDTGDVLGVISTGMPIANCTLDASEEYLYMTSSSILARVPIEFR